MSFSQRLNKLHVGRMITRDTMMGVMLIIMGSFVKEQ